MAVHTKEMLNLDELARYLDVSKSTLYKLVQRGGIPAQKIGKQWRFHKAAIDEWFRQYSKDNKQKSGKK